ncbi:gamma-aminobutyric acid type B receptor subunit 2 isoform X2 [Venturia canescens]|uniref:gamma-aminobutyric acid type B receptor subunit 2 isoform X2 n=1 Tax=Venturia canescens TaxID=32260 RepID=UPI001C9BC5D7|nr:gamma-aminobutyric acid type B receptor subunit 2 isoform X2 [Venturia canescens]
MSSLIYTESRTSASFPIISTSFSPPLIFNRSRVPCRRHSSPSLVSSVRKVLLFVIVLIHEIHRFGSTGAALLNEFGESRPTTTTTNKRRDRDVRESNTSVLRNPIVSGSTENLVKKYEANDYMFEGLPFDQRRDKVTRDIEHEMTNSLEVTRASKIVAYDTIIHEKTSIPFSGRDNNGVDEYLKRYSQQKPSSKHRVAHVSDKSNIFVVKIPPRVPRDTKTISNESLFNLDHANVETPTTDITKKLLVRSNGLDKYDKKSSKGTEKLSAEETTYKPAAAATQPFEKYDRRHFGPSRVENFKEFSKGTTQAVPRSSLTVLSDVTYPNTDSRASSISVITSSSTSSPQPPSTSLPSPTSSTTSWQSETLPDGTPMLGKNGELVNRRNDEEEEDENVRYNHDEKPRKSEVTGREKFDSDNESHANEDYVSIIDRLDEGQEHEMANDKLGKPTFGQSTIAGISHDLRQSSISVSKLSNKEHKLDVVTVRPQDGENVEEDAATTSGNELVDKLELTILGLFELTEATEPRPDGPSELQAARLAVDRINEMGILPNIKLRLIHNDTRCDPGVAVDRFFHALYTSNSSVIMPLLLGTACSEVTETLAKIVPYWNIVQVSYGSTAPALSDPTEFPLFVRTVAPDSSHNPARISLIKYFGWDTVTALSQNGDMYSLAVNDLVTELEQANITCAATITFGENDYKEQLRTLKELDTRIIIGSFSPKLAPLLFCEAWKLGMHGGDYAWILPGEAIDLSGMSGDWWHNGPEDCSTSQLSETLNGLIIVQSYGTSLTEEASYSGLTTSEFTSELAKRGVTLSKYAGQTYDAVWSMALALQKLEEFLNSNKSSIAQYNHSRKEMAHYLLEQLKSLNFVGVSGPVSFDGADRVGITAFYQMHGHSIRRIALYIPKNKQLTMNCLGCARIHWPGEHPPVARRVFRFRMVTIEYGAFLAVTCLASVGVTLAVAFLAFNLHFRKHKSIKLSSPRLNNMAAVGCALVYGAVILLGLDHATLSDSDGYFPTICTARAYLLSAGFSLAFGSMFTKTYRVHRIFIRSRSGVVKNKLLQDTQLISLIFVLLLIDCLVVTLWVTLDPMQRDLRNLTLEISAQDRAVIYQPQVEVCRSQHTNGWLAALYAYKGLLLIVGVYMAWETRHVKIPALNDSQYIGMSVYSVVITSGIVVVLANLMSDRATLAFVTITALILASTTATLALLFLPQLAHILTGERADPVVQSLGLKIECNTRRFVNDDSRELQYRVEVQNRVYRREMAQLELELARLEKQLGQEQVEPSHELSGASIPPRNPSIGGGLPLLLLSVLPPVIPRASWPSADSSGITERHASRNRSV